MPCHATLATLNKTVPLTTNTDSSALYTSALTTAKGLIHHKSSTSPLTHGCCHLRVVTSSAFLIQPAIGKQPQGNKHISAKWWQKAKFLCVCVFVWFNVNMSSAPVPTKITATKIYLYCCVNLVTQAGWLQTEQIIDSRLFPFMHTVA